MNAAPQLRILSADVAQRPWRLRIPFHYGVTTLRDALEVHVRCEIEVEGHGRAHGFAAEIAAPKWFNKSAALTSAQTVDRLVAAVEHVAAVVSRGSGAGSLATTAEMLASASRGDTAVQALGLQALELCFAVALFERAAVDGLCRVCGVSFPALLRSDGFGLAERWPHQDAFALDRWLRAAVPTRRIPVRHTVGLSDALASSDAADPPDGRPVAVDDVISASGVSRFKVKLGGSLEEIERLKELAAILGRYCPDYRVTLDANESFADPAGLAGMVEAIAAEPALGLFWSRVRYIEQPFDRSAAFAHDLGGVSFGKPLMIDESDDADDAFERALACGYAGVSIKTCKGVVRSVLNAGRAAMLRAQDRVAFVSAEDLCVQPGIALHQNLALAGALGLPDAERNGHHFGPGPSGLPAAERRALQQDHPDLYGEAGVRIEGGAMSAATSLDAAGFGTAICPDLANVPKAA